MHANQSIDIANMSFEDGIRASPSKGSSSTSLNVLGSNNYASWRDKMTAALVMNDVWDLVNGDRVKPTIPVAIQNTAGTANVNQASIDSATAELKIYIKDYKYAASKLLHAISDDQMYHVRSVVINPVEIWKKLQQKFERRTEMEAQDANQALITFQHLEIENANTTIERLEQVLDKCQQQGVPLSEQVKARMLLSSVNER